MHVGLGLLPGQQLSAPASKADAGVVKRLGIPTNRVPTNEFKANKLMA
jgi:hypothetical protein